jgi:hypothetical protein
MPAFSWQEGYGAFTVSASMLDEVKAYIANQEKHHARKSFQDAGIGAFQIGLDKRHCLPIHCPPINEYVAKFNLAAL